MSGKRDSQFMPVRLRNSLSIRLPHPSPQPTQYIRQPTLMDIKEDE